VDVDGLDNRNEDEEEEEEEGGREISYPSGRA